jgi:hypothetical protein
MTVKELINKLKQYLPETEVWLYGDDGTSGGEIESVNLGFVTDVETRPVVWPDLDAYEEIEEEKYKVVILG